MTKIVTCIDNIFKVIDVINVPNDIPAKVTDYYTKKEYDIDNYFKLINIPYTTSSKGKLLSIGVKYD